MNRVWISLHFGVLGAAVASVLGSAFGVKCLGFTAGIEVSKLLNVTSMSCNTVLGEFPSAEPAWARTDMSMLRQAGGTLHGLGIKWLGPCQHESVRFGELLLVPAPLPQELLPPLTQATATCALRVY